jgi:hypothetical protein
VKRIVVLALLALAQCGWFAPANAAQVVLCAARNQTTVAGTTVNERNLTRSYVADAQGCVIRNSLNDIGVLLANGWSQPGKQRSIVFNTGVASGTTSFLVGTLPAGAYIQQIIYNNTTANSAGNISFGSSSGGADVVAAAACAANCLTRVTDALLLKSVFSTTAPQLIYVTSSAWNSANLNITLVYGYF